MGSDFTYFRKKLLSWSKINLRSFPWRKTKNPYRVCVAEIMLHQTFARKVVPVYKAFVKRYPSVSKLSRANLGYLEKLIYPLGFIYRANTLINLARIVISEHSGKFPVDNDNLLSLPGVGNYTASAIMCFSYDKPVSIVDANVVRVYSRFFGLETKLPSSAPTKEIEEIAKKVLSTKNARLFNYGILDFAALICSHYNPKCPECPVKNKCKFMQG